MNLNFLSPLFLLGLLGISVPILIHLLTRRQQKHLRFSAVYLLFQSQRRSIKKSSPNRLLLLLLRCLGIALLSLALANPVVTFGESEDFLSSLPSANVFILDDSYSMATRAGETSRFQNAVKTLSHRLQKLPEGSAYSLVLASSPPQLLQEWTPDPAVGDKLLKAVRPSFKTTSIGKAFERASTLLEGETQRKTRIFLLTDLEKNGWDREEFPEKFGPQGTSVQIVDFSRDGEKSNRAAVQSAEVNQEFLTHSRVIRVKSRVINLHRDKALNRLQADLRVDGKKLTEGYFDLSPGATGEKEFSFPLLENETVSGRVEIPDDALTVDNIRYFSYQPDQNIKVLVVDGDPKTVAHQSETFYLERALNPFTMALSNIEPTVSTLEELPERDLFDFSVLILCNIRELPFDYELELEKFVNRGGALFIALGDQVDPKFYNERMGNLLPVTLESLRQADPGQPFRLRLDPGKHPVMKAFTGKTLQEMQDIRFHAFYSVTPREDRKFRVPLWFANDHPAVVESETGKGKVLLYVSTVDREWTNFPIQPTFLPWIQRWVKYSARGLETIHHRALRVGEPFIWKDELVAETSLVQTPGNQVYRLWSVNGEFRFEDTFRPGVYRLFRNPPTSRKPEEPGSRIPQQVKTLPDNALPAGTFTVNVDTRESMPGQISRKDVREWLGGLPVEFVSSEKTGEPVTAAEGWSLLTPLLLFMGGLLFIEGFLVRNE